MKPTSQVEEKTMNNEKIVDINISGIEKTKIRINGRNDSILELNLSDFNISERIEEGYAKLNDEITKLADIDMDSLENKELTKLLKDTDKIMRDTIDYIFDSNVSEVCCKTGTMFDIVDGAYKFEKILESLTSLYTENVNREYRAVKKRIQDKASKYIPQDHKKKSKSQKKRIEIQKDE